MKRIKKLLAAIALTGVLSAPLAISAEPAGAVVLRTRTVGSCTVKFGWGLSNNVAWIQEWSGRCRYMSVMLFNYQCSVVSRTNWTLGSPIPDFKYIQATLPVQGYFMYVVVTSWENYTRDYSMNIYGTVL